MTEPDSRAAPARRRAMPTRRKLLLGGASVAVLGGAGLAALFSGSEDAALAGVRRADAEPMGDGFYRVDGWVLTEADLAALPG